tara:strand:- start:45 stop:467 length:423 start_codon:yes stop_codon:yes gene_type:complete
MIKFKLTCKECSKTFDSWFSSSIEFEKLKRLKYINCINCNSSSVKKSLMAPNVLNSKNDTFVTNNKFKEIRKKIKEYQKFVEKNFKYVGNNFTYEARSIHYNKNKNKKGIYGNASPDEIKDLKNEGIETEVIPWIKDKEN